MLKKTRTRFDDLLVTNKTAKYALDSVTVYLQISSYNFRKYEYWEAFFGKLVRFTL
jgi:miniconductance mechanosensitive channel